MSIQTENLHRAETGATYRGRDGDRKRRPQEIGTRKIKEGVERGREGIGIEMVEQEMPERKGREEEKGKGREGRERKSA